MTQCFHNSAYKNYILAVLYKYYWGFVSWGELNAIGPNQLFLHCLWYSDDIYSYPLKKILGESQNYICTYISSKESWKVQFACRACNQGFAKSAICCRGIKEISIRMPLEPAEIFFISQPSSLYTHSIIFGKISIFLQKHSSLMNIIAGPNRFVQISVNALHLSYLRWP